MNQDIIDPILHCCLDILRSGNETISSTLDRFPSLPKRLRRELEAALWLMLHIPALEPRSQFLTVSRRRILVRIQEEHNMQSQLLRSTKISFSFLGVHTQPAFRVLTMLILVFSMLLGGSGITLASLHSLPDDPFYPLKVTLERVALLITPGRSQDLKLHMQFTQRRLHEIQDLILEGHPEWVASNVARFQIEAEASLQGLEDLSKRDGMYAAKLANSFQQQIDDQNEKLGSMQDAVPLSSLPAIEETLRASYGILQGLAELELTKLP